MRRGTLYMGWFSKRKRNRVRQRYRAPYQKGKTIFVIRKINIKKRNHNQFYFNMKETINFSINLSKIDKKNIFIAKSGDKFLNGKIVFKDEEDQYGNTGMIFQGFKKENQKDASGDWVKTPILGNVKPIVKAEPSQEPVQEFSGTVGSETSEDDGLPF